MKILTYTQRGGFESYEFPGEYLKGESTEDLLKRLGYECLFSQGDDHSSIGGWYEDIRYHASESGWLVQLIGDCDWLIYVGNEADLMGLRVNLAPLMLTQLLRRLDPALQSAARTFRHQWEHDPEEPCAECKSSHEHWLDEQRRKETKP